MLFSQAPDVQGCNVAADNKFKIYLKDYDHCLIVGDSLLDDILSISKSKVSK